MAAFLGHRDGAVSRGLPRGDTDRPHSRAGDRRWRVPDRVIAHLRVPERRTWQLSLVSTERAGALAYPVRGVGGDQWHPGIAGGAPRRAVAQARRVAEQAGIFTKLRPQDDAADRPLLSASGRAVA